VWPQVLIGIVGVLGMAGLVLALRWHGIMLGQERVPVHDLRFLYRTIQLTHSASLPDSMELVMRELTRHLAADLGQVFLLDDDELLQLSVSVGSSSPQKPLSNWEFTLPHLALAADEPIIMQDLRHWPQLRSFIPTAELASTLWLPLKASGRAVGVLGLGSRQPHAFDTTTVAMVGAVASYLATAAENHRLRRQVQQERTWRQTLQRYVSPRLVTSVQNRGDSVTATAAVNRSSIASCSPSPAGQSSPDAADVDRGRSGPTGSRPSWPLPLSATSADVRSMSASASSGTSESGIL